MKKRSSTLSLVAIGFLLFAVTAAVIGQQLVNSFDSRNWAAIPVIRATNLKMVNGERISIDYSGNSFGFFVTVYRKSDNGKISEQLVNQPGNNGYMNFTSAPLQSGRSSTEYYVSASPCVDVKCDSGVTELNPIVSGGNGEFVVQPAVGGYTVSDASFCMNDLREVYISPDSKNTTRNWLKLLVTNKDGKIVDQFYEDTANLSFCMNSPEENNYSLLDQLVNKAYACSHSTRLTEGEGYNISMYGCHENCSACTDPASCASCDKSCDMQMVPNPYKMTPSKPIPTYNYIAPICSKVSKVDIGISEFTVNSTQPLNENSNIDFTLKLMNYGDIATGTYTVALSISNSTGLAVYNYSYLGSSLVPQQEFKLPLNSIAGFAEGTYTFKASVSLDSTQTDTDLSNNTKSQDVVFKKPVVVCQPCSNGQVLLPDCRCVDCIGDANCSATKKCDTATNSCVCNSGLCTAGKVMNNACTACVCSNSCSANQWQDSNCGCHNNSCTLSCNSKQVLQADCTCKDVECTQDAQCGGLNRCNGNNNKCECSANCGTGFKANAACTACVCASTCASGQTQRADCSCVTSNQSAGEIKAAADTSKLVINPLQKSVIEIGEKVTLGYTIVGTFNFESSKIKWVVDGATKDGTNGLAVSFDKSGEKIVKLMYDGKQYDTKTITVLKTSAEGANDDTTNQTTVASNGSLLGIIAFVIGSILAVALISTILLILVKRRKSSDENQ